MATQKNGLKQEKEIKSIHVCFYPRPPRDEIFADDEIQKNSRDEIFAGDKKFYETFRGFAEKPPNPRKFIPAKMHAVKVIIINPNVLIASNRI